MATSKREMAIFIVSELLDQRIKLTNWQTKLLMAVSSKEIEKLYKKAQEVMNVKADLEILWNEAIGKCTPNFLNEIDARGDWS